MSVTPGSGARATAVLLSAVLLLPAARPTGAAERPAPVFESGVGLVRVTVVVRDRSGALVRGLKREDFAISEDGKPQAIESFDFEDLPTEHAPGTEQEAAPPLLRRPAPAVAAGAAKPAKPAAASADLGGRRLVVLFFDTNGMEPEQLQRGVASAQDYVRTRMTASDSVAVVSLGSGLSVLQDFTADRAALARALGRLVGATDAADTAADPGSDVGSDADAFSPDTSELDLFNVDRRLRAIEDLSKALAGVVQKKSVIYFSGGMSGVGADNQV